MNKGGEMLSGKRRERRDENERNVLAYQSEQYKEKEKIYIFEGNEISKYSDSKINYVFRFDIRMRCSIKKK